MPVYVANYITKTFFSLIVFILLQSCTSGTTGVSTVNTPSEPNGPDVTSTPKSINCTLGAGADMTISGQLKYERIGHNDNGGLNYNDITLWPIRAATVQIICGSSIVRSMQSDEQGGYSFNIPSGSVNVFVRVRAELKKVNKWDFSVVDNTRSQALYVMDSAAFSTDSNNITKGLLAVTGLDASLAKADYTAPRVAAPFAILDTVYNSLKLILTADAQAAFPELKLNWSVNNSRVDGDLSKGEIASSFFGRVSDPVLKKLPGSDLRQIFILGYADSDTDEFDKHVIAHEWGHYFEHYFSRSDSIGGSHSGGDFLDMRVSFGEGFGNAFSAMVTGDPVYKDSSGSSQSLGFDLNVDDNNCLAVTGSRGFFSECSVQAIMYDLFDDASETGDNVSLGFSPLYRVLTNEQKTTKALSSLFSFISPLRDNNVTAVTAIDALTAEQGIQNITDIYGISENNTMNNPGSNNILPIYKNISIGSTMNVCSTAENRAFGQDRNGNKLGVNRYLKLDLTAGQTIKVSASRTSGLTESDPDIEIYKQGVFQEGSNSDKENADAVSFFVPTTDEYIIIVYEYNYYINITTPDTTCFDIKITLN